MCLRFNELIDFLLHVGRDSTNFIFICIKSFDFLGLLQSFTGIEDFLQFDVSCMSFLDSGPRGFQLPEEALRLSQFNAEILSHRNPTQKILYVDRIRKELAETKQKLALSTRDTESALEEVESLRGELAMYKSVTVPFDGKPRTTMTRVRRVGRVPLSTKTLNTLHGSTAVQDVEEEEEEEDERYNYNTLGEMTMDELS